MRTVMVSGRQYCFRPLALAEVACVNRMLCAEYGDSYPYPLRAERLSPQSIYIACLDEHGEIVAFSKAEYRAPHGFYEVGGLIIAPGHRVAGLGTTLVQYCVEEASRRGAQIVFAEPVCYRADRASQRLFIRLGFRHWAIEPFKYPNIQKDHLGDQPETVTVGVLAPEARMSELVRPLFVPRDYVDPITFLLGHELSDGEDEQEARMPAVIDYDAVQFEGYFGSSFRDVPANWPEARKVIEAARAEGFLLSGLLPGFGRLPHGAVYDYVRLYRPPSAVRPDFARVHVVEDFRPFLDAMRVEHRRRFL